ncbi:hypothetical protein NBO_27g0054 [Nosema bombycis CQ1]|uniref:RRM Nup35-type domain-containing protein n=1 Tax=Nosema bombycis (strain CQ1 / CVCC 102059) TaxID=578461 RepID=R0M960_NOSB1|nr:hypothetical protein NBO_27g0054 [Nosema bombycis CQ1]|eukprot:EOB14499.1 hypothetical protein NBO_27g0054 [Nosema bombycis CQ1]
MYHPRVFKRTEQKQEENNVQSKNTVNIPENTLYEEPLLVQRKPNKKYITVFGFSGPNLENVINKIKQTVQFDHVEYGKNWINVMIQNEEDASKLLKLNTCYVNGEVIGVFRESYGVIDDRDIFLKKKGVFSKLLTYLFGE